MRYKTTFTSPPAQSKYPWIGRLKESPQQEIVLFTGPRKGFCLSSGINPLGSSSEFWMEEDFVPVDSVTITLEK